MDSPRRHWLGILHFAGRLRRGRNGAGQRCVLLRAIAWESMAGPYLAPAVEEIHQWASGQMIYPMGIPEFCSVSYLPYYLVQDFFHPQYVNRKKNDNTAGIHLNITGISRVCYQVLSSKA